MSLPAWFIVAIHNGDYGLWFLTGCLGPAHYSEINILRSNHSWEVDEVLKEKETQRKKEMERGRDTKKRKAGKYSPLTKECDSLQG